jgi:predicted dehydrogenase
MSSLIGNIALFGVGRWGVHLLRNFLNHPQAQVLAVVDPSAEQLARVKQQFDLDDTVLLTTDWAEAMNLPALTAAVIVTPAVTHVELIRAALQRGLHVLAEKPLTLDPMAAVELCRLADRQQRQLVIDHTYLFHPAITEGKKALPLVGERRYGYATRTHLAPVRQDVDALWDLAIHDIAILNHWLEECPVTVQAQGSVWLQPQITTAHSPQGLADTVWSTLIYASGFRATLHHSWLNPDKQRRLAIVGSLGSLVFDELAAEPLVLQSGGLDPQGAGFQPTLMDRTPLTVPPLEPLGHLCDHFLACIRDPRAATISPGWLGAELVQVLSALSASLQVGGMAVAVDRLAH